MKKISERRALVKGLKQTVGCERARVTGRTDAELVRVWFVITAAPLERERTVIDTICDVRDGFPIEGFSDGPGPSVGVHLIRVGSL